MRKGQSAIEAMMSMGVILTLILLLYNFVIGPRIQEANDAQTFYLAKSLCNDLSNTINIVAFNGNGFNQGIDMPSKLWGKSYQVTIYKMVINVNWSKNNNVFCQYKANVTYKGVGPPFLLDVRPHLLNNSRGNVSIA